MVKGNIILSEEELSVLRTSLLKRYSELTGDFIRNPEKLLNSNLNNYTEIFESIDKTVGLRKMGITTAKPLATLYHFSKRGTGSRSFRRKFIYAIKAYIGDELIHPPIKPKLSINPPLEDAIGKLRGYWECIYSTGYTPNDIIKLKVIAIWINSDYTVKFLDSDGNVGGGLIEILGNNLILRLSNEYSSVPSILMMTCGAINVDRFPKHIEVAAGVFTFLNPQSGSITATKSVMLYHKPEQLKDKYQTDEVNLENKRIQSQFLDSFSKRQIDITEKMDKLQLQLASFFFHPDSPIESNLLVFASDTYLAITQVQLPKIFNK